jgi:hypothetical protein
MIISTIFPSLFFLLFPYPDETRDGFNFFVVSGCHRMEWFPSSVQRKTIEILHKWSESFYAKKIKYIYVQPSHYTT